MQSIIILGRQPKIGLAELEALFGAKSVIDVNPQAAGLDLDNQNVPFGRLGGALKLGEIIGEASVNSLKNDLTSILKKLSFSTGSKINLGVSYYGLQKPEFNIGRLAIDIKKSFRLGGFNVRVVPNREPALNTAQVLHNKLVSAKGLEVLLIQDGQRIVVARTTAVQDIDDYTARDRVRPKRDAFVGMLPPKLAQIIVNLAASNTKPSGKVLLDPFCGTGVVLQEALLMGFKVHGSDLSPKMVDYSRANLEWLVKNWQLKNADYSVETADAQTFSWKQPIDIIAGETYLGQPFSSLPPEEKLSPIINDVNILLKRFLINLRPQLNSGTRLCLAVPAWKVGKSFQRLSTLDHLEVLGYNQVVFEHADSKDLIYFRPDQIVARELLILIRK